jgi:hypothetical protein
MTIRQIFLLFFLLYFSSLHAQAPGYLGKRMLLKADIGLIPTISGPTAANQGFGTLYGAGKTGLAFSTRFGGEVSYTISRKMSVGLGVNYFKTGGIMENVFTRSIARFASPNDFDIHYLFYNLSAVTADISIKSFKLNRGAIAPLGSYFAYHYSRSYVKGEMLDKRTEYAYKNSKSGAFTHNPAYTLQSIGLEWGYNTALSDRILLDFSSRLSVPFDLRAFGYAGESNSNDEYVTDNQNKFDNMVVQRMLNHSLIMVHLGIGVLLF